MSASFLEQIVLADWRSDELRLQFADIELYTHNYADICLYRP